MGGVNGKSGGGIGGSGEALERWGEIGGTFGSVEDLRGLGD